MQTGFDPAPLIALARELSASGPEGEVPPEVKLRAAIGRVYYAVFNVARRQTGVVLREGVHGAVVYQVSRRYGMIVGRKLDRLKQMREIADYEYPVIEAEFSDWKKNWDEAAMIADHVLEKLKLRR